MKAFIGILIVFNIYFASSLPVPESTVHQNPCTPKALYEVQYYHFCPMHDNKYIICDPWGGMQMEECPSGSKWIKESVECVFSNATEEYTKMTSSAKIEKELIMMPNMSVTVENFTCSFFGEKSCLNGGMCVKNDEDNDYRCLCLDEFSGRFCEVKGVKSTGVFGLLINSTFSLDLYKQNRPLDKLKVQSPNIFSEDFNQTVFNSSLLTDSVVRKKIETYLSMFAPKTIRFDSLVNYILEDYMSTLWPKEFFLQEFNSVDEMKNGFYNVITNLLYASKYYYDSADKFFAMYEQVVLDLVKYLGDKEPNIREQAQKYFDVYEVVNSKIKTYTSWVSVNATQAEITNTRDFVIQEFKRHLNGTLRHSYELYRLVNEFQDRLSYKMQLDNSTDMAMIDMCIMNFTKSPEVKAHADNITHCNVALWDLLSFYGFSRVLSSYITIPADRVLARETTYNKTFDETLSDAKQVEISALKMIDNSTLKVAREEEEEYEERRGTDLNGTKSDNRKVRGDDKDDDKKDDTNDDERRGITLDGKIVDNSTLKVAREEEDEERRGTDLNGNSKINKTTTDLSKLNKVRNDLSNIDFELSDTKSDNRTVRGMSGDEDDDKKDDTKDDDRRRRTMDVQIVDNSNKTTTDLSKLNKVRNDLPNIDTENGTKSDNRIVRDMSKFEMRMDM